MRDFGLEAQRVAAEHLSACNEALFDEEVDPHDPLRVSWPAEMAAPYCGCETCIVREVLFAAWPILRAAAFHEFNTGSPPPTP